MARVRAQFETNVFGPLRLTQLVLPAMRRRGRGRIVNVSSMGGRLVFPGGGVYHASKYALEALSDALRFELRPFGIAVVLIEPGLVRTQFAATVGAHLASMPVSDDAATDDAAATYAAFNDVVARGTRRAYETRAHGADGRRADRRGARHRPRHRRAASAGALHRHAVGDVLPDLAPLAR